MEYLNNNDKKRKNKVEGNKGKIIRGGKTRISRMRIDEKKRIRRRGRKRGGIRRRKIEILEE